MKEKVEIIENRKSAIKNMILAIKRGKEIDEHLDNKYIDEGGILPLSDYPDEFGGDASDLASDAVKQEYDEYYDFLESQPELQKQAEDLDNINRMIRKGATLEEVSKYIHENEVYIRDILDLELIENGKITNIRDELIEYNRDYQWDPEDAIGDMASDLARKGIEVEELPEKLLFEPLFVYYYMEEKASREVIDKNFQSDLIGFFEHLKSKENMHSLSEVTELTENLRESDNKQAMQAIVTEEQRDKAESTVEGPTQE